MARQIYKAVILDVIDDRHVKVIVEEKGEMVADVSGKVRMVLYDKIVIGNEVIVEISPYDQTRCRLAYR
jgi:translation initiation factor IF-1